MKLAELAALVAKMTEGPWEADCPGARHGEDAQCVAINGEGRALFDTLNRDYRHSEVMNEDGRYFDIGGKPDIEGVVALRNHAKQLLAVCEAAEALSFRIDCQEQAGHPVSILVRSSHNKLRAALRDLEGA